MRILLVTDFYEPYSGGVEIHVRTVAHELARRGHAVAVASLVADKQSLGITHDGPIAVYPIRHLAQRFGARFNHADRPWAPPLPDPMAMRWMRKAIEEFKPDVIHGHDWLARSAQPTSVSGDIPVVTSLHYYTRTCAKKTLWREGTTCSGPGLAKCIRCAGEHYGRARGALVTLGLRAGSRMEDAKTDVFISVSSATERGNGLTGRPGSVVVPNPVTTFSDGGVDEQLLPLQGIEDRIPDGPFILFVGDIRAEKGLAVLAEAVEDLRANHGDDTPFVVVGERMSQSIRLPPGTVEVGHIPNRAVHALWRRATVGVVPSLWPEPFGLVAIEAMDAGCPLVASDVGGLAEILADGRGVLVTPGDASQLAKGIAELLGDESRRDEIARTAKAAVGDYSLVGVVDRIEDEYARLVGAAVGVDRGPR